MADDMESDDQWLYGDNSEPALQEDDQDKSEENLDTSELSKDDTELSKVFNFINIFFITYNSSF